MGGAMLRRWLASELVAPGSAVFEIAPSEEIDALCTLHGLALLPSPDDLDPDEPDADTSGPVDLLVIAVKPQGHADALAGLPPPLKSALTLSVMAGVTHKTISASLGGNTRIVRAMPNLPSLIGAGMTGLYAPQSVTASDRSVIETLIMATGDAVWVDREDLLDAVTAISGSGPAYLFHFAECLAEAGISLGLPPEAAARLARQTVAGAGAMLADAEADPAILRQRVTSPGGTTAAALEVFMDEPGRLKTLVREATAAAARRAGALAR